MVSYKEIAKPVDEILEKQFVHNKPWAVDLKHKLNNPSLKLSGHLAGDGKVSCASSSGLGFGPLTVNGLFGSDGSAGLQLTYNSDFAAGLTVQANVSSAMKTMREQKMQLQAKYERDPWRAHVTLDPVDLKWGLAVSGKHAILKQQQHYLSWGLDVSGDNKLTAPALSGFGFGYSYPVQGKTISTAVTVAPHNDQTIGRISLAFASQNANRSEIAARYTYIPSEDRGELSAGAGWILDTKTRLTSIKARIDNQANVAASLTNKLNDSASITIGVGFDNVTDKSAAAAGAKVGVRLNLTA